MVCRTSWLRRIFAVSSGLAASPQHSQSWRRIADNAITRMLGGVRFLALPSDLRLRRYQANDLDGMVALDAACFEPEFRFSRSAMRRFAEADNAWTCLAQVEGKLAGFTIVHLEQAPLSLAGYLVTIDVDREQRRHGVGQAMLRAAEIWLEQAGAEIMLLHVYVNNPEAILFYERMGYRKGEEQSGFYGPGMDAVLYWKRLVEPATASQATRS